MFNSTILDVAAGLIFVFLAVSLAVSATVEALASWRGWRAQNLLQGLGSLLNDPAFAGLARQVYNHALINPRDTGKATTPATVKNAPSYIDPAQFADALLESITRLKPAPDGAAKTIQASLGDIEDEQLKHLLQGIYRRANGDYDHMRTAVASWFDNGMDRLSGSYKRRTQAWSFAIAVVIAVSCNVSSIEVARALWQQPILAHTLAPTPGLKVDQALDQIRQAQLPVGWTCDSFNKLHGWTGLEMLVGWLITALATLFGAPFWFDALQQFVRLKGSGPSPQEKKSGSGASA